MILSQTQMFFLFVISTKVAICTISGINYMDPLNFIPLPDKDRNDACNPLYWYPRAIPEYCYLRSTPKPYMALPPDDLVPLPIPVPLPQAPIYPFIAPISTSTPCPKSQRLPLKIPLMMPPMLPALPPPVPFGVPLVPSSPMLPVSGAPVPGAPFPYPYPPYAPPQPYAPPSPSRRQFGMVPGIRGLVSDDGGINILPFSDAYSDLLENQKTKILNKRLRNLLDDYHRYPRRRRRRGRRRHNRRFRHY